MQYIPQAVQPRTITELDVLLHKKDQVEALVDLYFEAVHPMFPILHPILERRKLLSNILKTNYVLIGVLMNSFVFADDMLHQKDIPGYTDCIKSVILLECFRVQNIDELTAMTLLAFHNYGISNGPETWSTVAIVANGCIHLRLVEETSPSPASELSTDDDLKRNKKVKLSPSALEVSVWAEWVTRETKRNLLWAIVTLDHLTSLASFFSPKVSCYSVHALLPAKLDIWQDRSSFHQDTIFEQRKSLKNPVSINDHIYDTHCYKVEVINLMEGVQEFMKNPKPLEDVKSVLEWEIAFTEQEEKISLWRESLPLAIINFLATGELALGQTVSVGDVLFHSLYHTLIIRLNSAIAFPQVNEKLMILAKLARMKCIHSAKLICQAAKSIPGVLSGYHHRSTYQYLGPFYAFSLWVAGRVLLVDSLDSRKQIESELSTLLNVLRVMGSTWGCAVKYADILEFFRTSIQQPLPTAPKEKQLISDMSLHAASLEALLAQQKGQALVRKSTMASQDSIYDLFKIPATESLMRDSSHFE